MGLQSQPGPVYRVREILSSSVAHEDIECNVLMSRNDHIWEALINLCLPPWLVLPSCEPSSAVTLALNSRHLLST